MIKKFFYAIGSFFGKLKRANGSNSRQDKIDFIMKGYDRMNRSQRRRYLRNLRSKGYEI